MSRSVRSCCDSPLTALSKRLEQEEMHDDLIISRLTYFSGVCRTSKSSMSTKALVASFFEQRCNVSHLLSGISWSHLPTISPIPKQRMFQSGNSICSLTVCDIVLYWCRPSLAMRLFFSSTHRSSSFSINGSCVFVHVRWRRDLTTSRSVSKARCFLLTSISSRRRSSMQTVGFEQSVSSLTIGPFQGTLSFHKRHVVDVRSIGLYSSCFDDVKRESTSIWKRSTVT